MPPGALSDARGYRTGQVGAVWGQHTAVQLLLLRIEPWLLPSLLYLGSGVGLYIARCVMRSKTPTLIMRIRTEFLHPLRLLFVATHDFPGTVFWDSSMYKDEDERSHHATYKRVYRIVNDAYDVRGSLLAFFINDALDNKGTVRSVIRDQYSSQAAPEFFDLLKKTARAELQAGLEVVNHPAAWGREDCM